MNLAALVEKAWGIVIDRLEPSREGFDADAATYRGFATNGRSYFLKHRRVADDARGALVALALREAGMESSLAPLRTRDGAASLDLAPGSLLVHPFIEGTNGFERPLSRDQWREFGASVRFVHETDPPLPMSDDDFRLPRTYRFGETASKSSGRLAEVWSRHAAAIERVRRRESELGTACRSRSWPQGLCHADLHVGNVLADSTRLYVVDWDGARRAPRERDLMFVLDGGILGAHGADEEAAFFEGYGACEADPLLLTYYRYAWALDDLLSFAEEGNAVWFERQFDPRGIVASAFRSDDRLGHP